MSVSADVVICPFCKAKHPKGIALSNSGTVVYNGYDTSITCTQCNKDFRCEIVVAMKFKTYKEA